MSLSSHAHEKIHSFIRLNLLSGIGTFFFVSAATLFVLRAKTLAIKLLFASIRYSYSWRAIRLLETKFRDNSIDLSKLLSGPATKEDAHCRAIILSPPKYDHGKLQKGVILLSFSHTFSYFLQSNHWQNLDRFFAFVLEPSWAGYADPDIFHFLAKAEHCVIQASEIEDRALINTIFPHIPCLDVGASNWVDHDKFAGVPTATPKEYDAIYIANLNPIKRVYRAIDAFSEAKNSGAPDFQGIIVCASWGKSSLDAVASYVEMKGLNSNITIRGSMAQGELINVMNRCKCSILLSLKEGSNRVLFESMFVGLPVICLSENVGVNKAYINEHTGLLVSDFSLPKALTFMSSNYTNFLPRSWALQNISPEVTTKRLRSVIINWFGASVNSQLEVKVNGPEVSYKDEILEQRDIVQKLFNAIGKVNDTEFVETISDLFIRR